MLESKLAASSPTKPGSAVQILARLEPKRFLMEMKGIPAFEIILEDCRVPKEKILGKDRPGSRRLLMPIQF
jgi:alkylation response protein AidB-like acyl-CoA dehydrogenase